MQQKPGDIYHEDVTPHLAKRSRRHTSERRKRTSRQRNEAKQKEKSVIVTPTQRSSRRRRTSQNQPSSLTALILWVVIGLILVAYLGFLGSSYARRRTQIKQATAQINQAAPPAPKSTHSEDVLINVAMIKALSQQQQQVRQEIDIALSMLEDNNQEQALARLNDLHEAFPQDIEVSKALAKAHISAKNYSESSTLLYGILTASPDHDEARIMLAQALLQQNQLEEALAIATWLLDANPYSLRANDIAANAYLAMNKPSWSIPYLRRIITHDRENFSALNRMAKAFADMGEYQKAVLEFTRMIDMDLADSVTYCNLAICYAQQMKAEPSVIILDQAADKYGYLFVYSWLERSEFDPIRNTPPFKAFSARKRVLEKQNQTASP